MAALRTPAPQPSAPWSERVLSPQSPDYFRRGWLLASDPAVEVASENQFAPGTAAKARFYLQFGKRLVWDIWPRYKRVDVRRPGDESPTSPGIEDALSGEDVVPGFTFPVAHLFPVTGL